MISIYARKPSSGSVEPNNKGNKDQYQAETPSCTRIRHHLPDHDDTMREDFVLDAYDQLAAKSS